MPEMVLYQVIVQLKLVKDFTWKNISQLQRNMFLVKITYTCIHVTHGIKKHERTKYITLCIMLWFKAI